MEKMLEVDIFCIDTFVKVNNLKEVTNPIVLERDNIPTVNGLLSYEIFGRTTTDRSSTYAYIELNGHFLHPHVYKVWKRINRKIEEIVSGTDTFSVDKMGELVKDPNGWTGLENLYKHMDEIKFREKDSQQQAERIAYLKALKKDEIFCTKWLVCPPFYRDLQLDKANVGKVSMHQKTQLYSKMLRLAKALKNDQSGIEIITNSTRNRIQSLLCECWTDEFMHDIKGKNGLFRKSVMGKSVDYGARFVITSPTFDVDSPKDMLVTYEYAGLPLAGAVTCFFPFFIKWLKDYFYNELYLRKDKYPVMHTNGSTEYVKLINVEQFNDDYFTKAMDSFIHSYGDRFKTISLENDKGYNLKMRISVKYTDIKNVKSDLTTISNRDITWTDLLFMAAEDICKDKHILVTRYPLEDYFGIFPCKIRVSSTIDTTPAIVSGKFYRFYPVVDPSLPPSVVSTLFRDSLSISNLYLRGLGGDYDGDQVSVRGVWDINANKRCHENMYMKKNFLNISGGLMRGTEREAVQTLYSLTCDESEIDKDKQ